MSMKSIKFCQSRRYDNFTLFGVLPIEVDHLRFLQNLEKQKYIDMSFWRRPNKLYHDVQFIVNPADKELFKERAAHFRMPAEILQNDIQQAFDNQTIRRYPRLKTESFSWEHYHTIEDIYQWLSELALRFPSFTELSIIGKSAEGRDIFALGIKRPGTKGKVIVEGGIHGNEWVAVEFVTYLANQLIHCNETRNSRLSEVAHKYDWYLIPLVNPDGYDFTQKVDRLWKKNRRSVGGGFGVDLNRNFDYNFGAHAASNNPIDEQYCGSSPFSEPETNALADFITNKKENLKFYFSIHAYGQKIVIPYSDRVKHVDDYNEMMMMMITMMVIIMKKENYGKQAIMKMYKLFGTKYSVGTFYDTLGLRLSGNSASWVKKNFKVKHIFTLLLRDNGSYGYALPPDQILPTCKEALVGMVELMTARPKRIRASLFNSATSVDVSNTLLSFVLCVVKYKSN
ncbi:zinc carboxypeptidase [Aphomia sociella]